MFETDDMGELKYMSALAGKGRHVWAWATPAIAKPWFHTVVKVSEGDGWLEQVLFLTTVGQLIQVKQTTQIIHLDLVSPKYLNGSDRWEMTPLMEILEGEVPGDVCEKVYVYVTAKGDRYLHAYTASKESELCNLRTSFSLRDHPGAPTER